MRLGKTLAVWPILEARTMFCASPKVKFVALPQSVSCYDMTDSEFFFNDDTIHEDRLWCDDGWTARVIKNEDDDGWAVEMIQAGETEPALVGLWMMGRDKKNPKPFDANA